MRDDLGSMEHMALRENGGSLVTTNWSYLDLPDLSPRRIPLMAVVNEKTILILGGLYMSDGAVFNPTTMKVTQTFKQANFGYKLIGNQHVVAQFAKGLKVFALG